jgi:hypothetical protein
MTTLPAEHMRERGRSRGTGVHNSVAGRAMWTALLATFLERHAPGSADRPTPSPRSPYARHHRRSRP